MKKLSVSLSGHRTSISIENEFFDALQKIAAIEKRSIAAIIAEIDEMRDGRSNLSSAVRVWVLRRAMRD